MRIDRFLYEKNYAKSRTHAANLIQLSKVFVNGNLCTKPSFDICEKDKIEIFEEENFYSLGGCKLKKAIDEFQIDLKDKTAIDAGCANGGFTGVLLDFGAKTVYAIDVGENALPDALNDNPKVLFRQRNVRDLSKEEFETPVDFISADLSFISLTKVLPTFYEILDEGGEGVFLIKPQFEAGKSALGKTGIVTDEKIRRGVINQIVEFSRALGFQVLGVTEAPHPFLKKNQEYLLYCKR